MVRRLVPHRHPQYLLLKLRLPCEALRAVAALVQQAGVCCRAESGFIAEDCVVSGVVVGVWVGAAE